MYTHVYTRSVAAPHFRARARTTSTDGEENRPKSLAIFLAFAASRRAETAPDIGALALNFDEIAVRDDLKARARDTARLGRRGEAGGRGCKIGTRTRRRAARRPPGENVMSPTPGERGHAAKYRLQRRARRTPYFVFAVHSRARLCVRARWHRHVPADCKFERRRPRLRLAFRATRGGGAETSRPELTRKKRRTSSRVVSDASARAASNRAGFTTAARRRRCLARCPRNSRKIDEIVKSVGRS